MSQRNYQQSRSRRHQSGRESSGRGESAHLSGQPRFQPPQSQYSGYGPQPGAGTYEDRADAQFDPDGDRRQRPQGYGGPESRGDYRQTPAMYGDEPWDREQSYAARNYQMSANNYEDSGSGGWNDSRNWSNANRGMESAYGWQGRRHGKWDSLKYGEQSVDHGRRAPNDPYGDYGSSSTRPWGGQREASVGTNWAPSGSNAARGPKGWQRSDERIKEDVCECLYHSEGIDSSEVTVEVEQGKVTLDGTVPDRFMRHAIEDIVDQTPGVKDIDNRVRVRRQSGAESSESSASGSLSANSSATSTGTRTRKE